MFLESFELQIDGAQRAFGVALRLIGAVRWRRVAALAAGHDRHRVHAGPERDDRDGAGAVIAFGPGYGLAPNDPRLAGSG